MKRYMITMLIIMLALLLPMLSFAKLVVDVTHHSQAENEPYNHIVSGLAKKVPVHMDIIKSFLTQRLESIHTLITNNEDQVNKSNHLTEVEKFKIMIDAGHGGRDPGSAGVSETEEKLFTVSLANKVYNLLDNESGITPILIRKDDSYLSTEDRVTIANRDQVDLFISLHGNSFTDKNTRGTETYYYNSNSMTLAELLHEHIVQAAGFPDRKVRQMDYKVIKETTMPAALLEIGYMSNREEESIMLSEDMQNTIAASIVSGIKQYIMLEL